MEPKSAAWRMADRLAGGKLAETLVELDAAGKSSRQISREIADRFGVEASHTTVVSWLDRLNTPSTEGAA